MRNNRRSAEPRGLKLVSWETYGVATSYDKLLYETMTDIRRAYMEGRVWDMERNILFLISTLPSSVKKQAMEFFKKEYGEFKEKVRERLKRNLLPSFYEYKEDLLSRLIKVYSYVVDLLDAAGISIHGRRDSIEFPKPSSGHD